MRKEGEEKAEAEEGRSMAAEMLMRFSINAIALSLSLSRTCLRKQVILCFATKLKSYDVDISSAIYVIYLAYF